MTPSSDIILRDPEPGDMGWVVERHGALYAAEYGWTTEFEALVAEIVAAYLRNLDPARERCWIAERDGQRLGSVFVVKDEEDATARLRLLIVDPAARGSGLGGRLVDEAVAHARASGYRHMVLWTHGALTAARRLYAKAGFKLTESEEYEAFGGPQITETWRLAL